MPVNFHESYTQGEIKPPSERSTGLVFGAVAVLVAVLWRDRTMAPWVALGIGLALALVSLIAPAILKPLNILWFQFGLVVHRIVNPVVMFVVFAVVFVPAGMMMRLWRDPLKSRRTRAASSHWIELRDHPDISGTMKNQF